MMRPGDWNCPSCQHLNFSRRDSCQRCSDARPGGGDGGAPRRGGGSSSYGFASSYNEAGKSGGGGGSRGGFSDGALRPGDWYCSASACGAHNFASRSSCYKCGEFKDEGAGGAAGLSPVSSGGRGPRGGFGFGAGGPRQGWKSGDWICGRSGCTEHNFASRMECYRCNAPRQPDYEVAAM